MGAAGSNVVAGGNPAAPASAGGASSRAGAACRPSRAGLPGLLLLPVLLTSAPVGALDVPYLAGRVNDLADLIPDEAEGEIEARLRGIEEATGAQVAVLTLPGLEEEVLEDFAVRVFDTWRLGRADVDDGALLLIARDDRKMRLEVGYGLEPVLTDAVSKRILDDVLQPHFRAGDFAGGIEEAVGAIGGLLQGQDVLPPARAMGDAGIDLPLLPRLAFFAFFLLVVGVFSFAALLAPGFSGWMLYLFLTPFWWAFPLAIFGSPFGLLFGPVWLLGFPILRLVLPRASPRWAQWSKKAMTSSGRGWSSRGGWLGTPSRGFGGGGSSRSSGGFSGGGGHSGGGGASSGW